MVQGISGLGSGALTIAKVSSAEGSAPKRESQASSKASFEEMLQLTAENRTAAGSRLEDLQTALKTAGQVKTDIREARFEALSAHSGLTPERVAHLLRDDD